MARWIYVLLASLLFVAIGGQIDVLDVAYNDKCQTDTIDKGVCVYQYECINGSISHSGENIIDVRRLEDDCNDYLLVCCKDSVSSNDTQIDTSSGATTGGSESKESPGGEENGNEADTAGTAVPSSSTTESGSSIEEQKTTTPSVAGAGEASTTESPSKTINVPEYTNVGCGLRNPRGVLFSIQNDVHSETEYGEFPWVVAIFARRVNDSSMKYLCGGALIDQSAILTTASCLYAYRMKTSQIVVRLGEWDMGTFREPIRHVDSEVDNVYLHPAYGITSKINDIAVVILRDTIELGHTIGVVCLPPAGQLHRTSDLVGAGWGNVPSFVVPKKHPQTILKKAHLQLTPNGECQSVMRRLMGRKFVLHDSFICAVAIDTEMLPCQGDSGAPYSIEIHGGSDRFYLAGLSSWGYDCNKQSAPTVLTSIAHHREWIDGVIKKENLNTWSYTYEPSEDGGAVD